MAPASTTTVAVITTAHTTMEAWTTVAIPNSYTIRDSTSTGAPVMPSEAAAGISDGFTLSLNGLLNSLGGVAAEDSEGR